MTRRRHRWADLLAPVGQAGLDLFRAEYGVVSSEMKTSGRVLLRALLLLLIGLFAVFWAIGALALVLLEIGALWLPRWAAASAVLAIFLAVGSAFALVARKRLRTVESPGRTVRRRLDEHRDWWEQRIALFGPPAGERSRHTQSRDGGDYGGAEEQASAVREVSDRP